jgi:lipoprotein NlpD
MEGKLYGVLLTSDKDERVESLTEGTVVSAETYRGFGRVAIVQAPDGYVYVYGGNESLSVKYGDRVASGAELGRLGIDSLTGKPSLFLFVYKDNVAIDPAKAPRS